MNKWLRKSLTIVSTSVKIIEVNEIRSPLPKRGSKLVLVRFWTLIFWFEGNVLHYNVLYSLNLKIKIIFDRLLDV